MKSIKITLVGISITFSVILLTCSNPVDETNEKSSITEYIYTSLVDSTSLEVDSYFPFVEGYQYIYEIQNYKHDTLFSSIVETVLIDSVYIDTQVTSTRIYVNKDTTKKVIENTILQKCMHTIQSSSNEIWNQRKYYSKRHKTYYFLREFYNYIRTSQYDSLTYECYLDYHFNKLLFNEDSLYSGYQESFGAGMYINFCGGHADGATDSFCKIINADSTILFSGIEYKAFTMNPSFYDELDYKIYLKGVGLYFEHVESTHDTASTRTFQTKQLINFNTF